MKKWIFTIFILCLVLGSFNFVSAQTEKVQIDFFYSNTCSHCAEEKEFLNEVEQRYPEIEIRRFEAIYSSENQELLKELYDKYQVPRNLRGLVPATFTPEKYFIGFNEEIAKEIESCLGICLHPGESDVSLINTSLIEKNIKIPFLGEVKTGDLPFPVMAAVLGFLDGFNVCSLGALILILSLTLALKSKKKILIFGSIFILTTAIVYGFLITFWYKLFEVVISYINIMEILIGALGIGGGIYFLRQFLILRKKELTCEPGMASVISSKFLTKIKNLLSNPSRYSILLVVGAIFSFAIVVTIVEFPCSAVVPVAFSAVLAEAQLSSSQYLLYISIFILFYLLDEIIVFLIAFLTSKVWLSSPKFLKWIILSEALILFFLGFYYLFAISGQWLNF